MIKGILLSLSVVSFGALATGDYIAKDAVITGIANTDGQEDTFTVWVEGGKGLCSNQSIQFPRSAANNTEVHNRAYAAALAAFSTGTKVAIYNYQLLDC